MKALPSQNSKAAEAVTGQGPHSAPHPESPALPNSDKYSVMARYMNFLLTLNLTLFVGTRLIITRGYWFCLVASALFFLYYAIHLSPWTNLQSPKIYKLLFLITLVTSYLTIASFLFWYQHGAEIPTFTH